MTGAVAAAVSASSSSPPPWPELSSSSSSTSSSPLRPGPQWSSPASSSPRSSERWSSPHAPAASCRSAVVCARRAGAARVVRVLGLVAGAGDVLAGSCGASAPLLGHARRPSQRGSFACSASSHGPEMSSPRPRGPRPVLRGGGPVLGRGGAVLGRPGRVLGGGCTAEARRARVSTAATTTAASTPTSTTVNSPVIAFFISSSLRRLRGIRMRKGRTATVQARVRSW